jgi:hypothetical protein
MASHINAVKTAIFMQYCEWRKAAFPGQKIVPNPPQFRTKNFLKKSFGSDTAVGLSICF